MNPFTTSLLTSLYQSSVSFLFFFFRHPYSIYFLFLMIHSSFVYLSPVLFIPPRFLFSFSFSHPIISITFSYSLISYIFSFIHSYSISFIRLIHSFIYFFASLQINHYRILKSSITPILHGVTVQYKLVLTN